MSPPPIRNIITKESLQGTIYRDEASSYWFSEAIVIPQLDNLLKQDPSQLQAKHKMLLIMVIQKILFFVCIPVLLYLFLSFHHPLLFWLNIAILFCIFLLDRVKIKIVADAAWWWINKEFPPEELSSITYFQLTERLGSKYAIPTLVDTLSRWDWVLRKWLLASYVICSFILYFNFIHFIFIFFFVFCLTVLFLRYASA